jgi:hypothetical protein
MSEAYGSWESLSDVTVRITIISALSPVACEGLEEIFEEGKGVGSPQPGP